MNVVECNKLTKNHGQSKALNNLSLTIKENKITGLIGRNGSGKTTLLKILAGYWRETSGEVKVFSKSPFNNILVSANTIFIDDQMNFPTALTLKQILEQGESFYPNWDMELALRLFDYFSFDSRQFHNNLSKGNKSTFNMIIGLSAHCPFTIFDEPTTGMDAAVRKDFYRALLKDYLAHPRTIIISSHYLDELEDMLEDVILIENGEKYFHLPIEELKEYAIRLSVDNKTTINELINEKEVLNRTNSEVNQTYIVSKKDFSLDLIEKLRRVGVDVTPVSPSDICVYLTDKRKGGIDDVFN